MTADRKVLVTGASGFLGRALVERLLSEGLSIRLLNLEGQLVPKEWEGKAEAWTGDLTSPTTLKGVSEEIDQVYHFAGEIKSPKLFDIVNRAGTENLLRECELHDVKKFVYLSSVGVIGASGRAESIDEESTPRPRNAYERSKYAGECAALGHHHQHGMQVVVLRPSIVYGEGRPLHSDSFNSWLRSIERGYFRLLGEDYFSSYIYIGDVIAAALFIADSPKAGGEIYHINEPIALRAFVDEMSRMLGRKRVPALPGLPGQALVKLLKSLGRFGSLYNLTIFNVKKLSDLGFRLRFGYKEGIARTVEWYKGQKDLSLGLH